MEPETIVLAVIFAGCEDDRFLFLTFYRRLENLAEELNISVPHLWRIENGDRAASIDLMIVIAEYFSVSLDYLVLGKAADDTAIRRRVRDLAAELAAMAEKL